MVQCESPRRRGAKSVDATAAADFDALNEHDASEQQLLVAARDSLHGNLARELKKADAATAAPAKILFLDGVRGLAAIFVVTQHSREYMADIDLGAASVDAFFVLSSFLLTMIFMKKSIKLLAQGASYRKWVFTLADYFSKRFCRVYPLFAVLVCVLWAMPQEARARYYLVPEQHFDLYKVLTFDFSHRYFVLWTLPLEITYYFFIPAFVLVLLRLRQFWWLPFVPLYAWVIHEGWYEFRTSHMPLRPHFPTFLAGSMAAVIFVKIDTWIKATGFEFRRPHRLAVRGLEAVLIAVLLSVCFDGLFFDWVAENAAAKAPGSRFISIILTMLFLIEMLLPSCVSTMFEWNVLRYWGKISFSVYLLHSFVLYAYVVGVQPKYYNKVFSRFGLILLLSTASYHLIEYPSLLLAQRISRALAEQEAKGSTPGLPRFNLTFTIKNSAVKFRKHLPGHAVN